MTTVPYALTTKEKVKEYLTITDSSKDSIIDALINSVTDFIEGYCGGRRFLSTSYQEIKDATGKKRLFLNQYPATAISEVAYRSGLVSAPVWIPYSEDNYLKYLEEGYVQFYGQLPCVPQGMRVTYVAGYLIDFANEFDRTKHTLPFDLTQVATDMIATKMNTKDSEGISSQSTEGQSITFSVNKISSENKETLNRYKAIRYAN